MTPHQYKESLKACITMYDYWSNEVRELNNKAIDTFGYDKYVKLHNEVRAVKPYVPTNSDYSQNN